MKLLILTTLFLGVAITNSYAGNFSCMGDVGLNLKSKTISIGVWNIKDQKVTIFSNKDEDGQISYTAYSDTVILISKPDDKSGWSGEVNTLVTDLKNKRILEDECNISSTY